MKMTNRLKGIIKSLLGIIPWAENRKLQLKSINNYIRATPIKKIQFGCGPNFLDGWLNTDIYKGANDVVYMDILTTLPIPSNIFGYITSEHLIEHVSFAEGRLFLKECFRILDSKGKVRITTPNLETIIKLYHYNTLPEKEYIDHIINEFLPDVKYNPEVFVINNAFRNWGHLFLYNKATLTNLLTEIGFVNITETIPGESNDPHFVDIDIRNKSQWKKINAFEVMVLEASKP